MSENCQNLPASSRAESMACLKVGVTSPLHSSYERGCQAKTLLRSLSVRPRSVLASRPVLLVERILVLTPGAPHRTTGIQIEVVGFP